MFRKTNFGMMAAALALALALNGSSGTPGPTGRSTADLLHTATLGPSLSQDEVLQRMAGQMLLVGFEGTSPADAGVKAARAQLENGTIGGIVLFPDNIRSPHQLQALTTFLGASGPALTPLIAIDQEGGIVQRLGPHNGYADFPSARKVGQDPKLRAPEAAERLYDGMAADLAKAGINLNFGPVVDLSLNPWNRVINKRQRSFGSDPEAVAKFAEAFIAAHRKANILTAAKHFPGHGSSYEDSHKILPDISRTWKEEELRPYAELAKAKMLDMVMVGHLLHPRFSDGRLPASLSKRAIDILRDDRSVGFHGVVVSDDMEMGAVRDGHSLEESVVTAINAGIDLFIFSNVKFQDAQLGVKVRAIILAAVRDGRIDRTRIEQSYERIVRLKNRLRQRDLAARG